MPSMSTTPPQAVDVSGLPPEAVRHVQELADQLRAVYATPAAHPSHLRPGETP